MNTIYEEEEPIVMKPTASPKRAYFAYWLSAQRAALDMTQSQLADHAKIGIATIQRWERGETDAARITTLERLATALDTSLEVVRTVFEHSEQTVEIARQDPLGLSNDLLSALLLKLCELSGHLHDVPHLSNGASLEVENFRNAANLLVRKMNELPNQQALPIAQLMGGDRNAKPQI